jgi:putative transcriptional regulator
VCGPKTSADDVPGSVIIPLTFRLNKALVMLHHPRMKLGGSNVSGEERGFLDGKMLIATPSMRDERFARSVIYLCAHSSEGAMGIVVNQPARHIKFADLLQQLGVIASPTEMKKKRGAAIRVMNGGPVESGRGFVLHTSDVFIENSTLPIEDNICLTATLDILRTIASGDGPEQALLALGYAGWPAGQLEQEIHANGWLHCDADQQIVFDAEAETKYERALRKIGISPGMLSSEAGHA